MVLFELEKQCVVSHINIPAIYFSYIIQQKRRIKKLKSKKENFHKISESCNKYI